MKQPELWAVILAGGRGLRFWPRSRQARPKPTLALGTAKPLIVETVARLRGLVPPSRIFVSTAQAYARAFQKALPGLPRSQFILEPGVDEELRLSGQRDGPEPTGGGQAPASANSAPTRIDVKSSTTKTRSAVHPAPVVTRPATEPRASHAESSPFGPWGPSAARNGASTRSRTSVA